MTRRKLAASLSLRQISALLSQPAALVAGLAFLTAVFQLPSGQAPPAAAATPQQRLNLQYHLRLTRPTAHIMEIEIYARGATEPALDFTMPAWAPGRYAIYNFAKNVQEFQAT